MIEEMLAYNREFVRSRGYEKFQTSKFPDKKIAILTCMDTRLVELLPAALGIRNGDVKLIKNAGGMITGPFDSAVRSLLVGIIELGVEEVMVIGHTDCGVAHINADMMIRHLIQRGVSQDHIDMMRYCGIDFEKWLAPGLRLRGELRGGNRGPAAQPSPYARRCHHPRLRHQHGDRRVDPAGVKSAAGSDPNWADGVYFRPETVDKVVNPP